MNRVSFEYSSSFVGPQLERDFGKWRHVVEPSVDTQYVGGPDRFNQTIIVDDVDLITRTNEVEYAVTNRFFTSREVFSWRLAQKYFLDPTFGGAIVPGRRNVFAPMLDISGFAFADGARRFSPIVSTMRFSTTANTSTDLEIDYDTRYRQFRSAGIIGTANRGQFSGGISYFFTRRSSIEIPNNQLRGSLTYGNQQKPGFSGAFQFSYDVQHSLFQGSAAQVGYNANCYGLSFEVSQFNLGARVESRFRFAFTLKDIGSIGTLRPRETVLNMPCPLNRMRRLRRTQRLRNLVRETRLSPESMIYPIFVCPGEKVRNEVSSMPGQYNLSVDNAVQIAREAEKAGVAGILLFGLPPQKDEVGSDAYDENGIIQQALRAIRENVRDLLLITDVCMCEYTSHGHCGIIKHNDVQNDPTLKLLADSAVSHVRAGADMVAPSDMMDGRVAAIRQALDSEGFTNTPIMAYSAKYASGFYGPFREAAGATPKFGDRRSYQMDPPNAREALREIALDIEEGADIVMVKPAMPYLDIIARAREQFDLPIAAYQVSGEYAMIEAAARAGWIERERIILETTTAIKRAGADILITYYALELAKTL